MVVGVWPLSMSLETPSSLEAVATTCGVVGVVEALLDWPGKFANFLLEGVYSQGSSLSWHRAHLGRSPLHFVL